jgi:hypothetical protein
VSTGVSFARINSRVHFPAPALPQELNLFADAPGESRGDSFVYVAPLDGEFVLSATAESFVDDGAGGGFDVRIFKHEHGNFAVEPEDDGRGMSGGGLGHAPGRRHAAGKENLIDSGLR